MIRTLLQHLFLALFVCLIAVSNSWGAPSISINGSGNVFTVQGEGLEGVGGLDLTIGYDPATLTNPRVVLSELFAGAMMQSKSTGAGILRIVLLATPPGVSGSGGIGTISFDPVGKRPGIITSFASNAVTSAGASLTPQSKNLTPDASAIQGNNLSPATGDSPDPQATDLPGDTASTRESGESFSSPNNSVAVATGSPGTAFLPGTVAMQVTAGDLRRPAQRVLGSDLADQKNPGNDQQEDAPPSASAAVEASPVGEPYSEPDARPETPEQKPVQVAEPKTAQKKSVLSLFRDFTGARSVENLLSLFDRDSFAGFTQTPEIVLADGKNRVKVSVAWQQFGQAPNFSCHGGKLVSFSKEQGKYTFEIQPDRNAIAASLAILVQNEIIEVPLTVAPPLDARFLRNGRLDEKSFALFLREKNPQKSDVTGDGVRNYVDEYTYAANYLALRRLDDQKGQ